MVASLAMTAVYHAGYRDFRSDKLRKPVTGDLVWSVPTLATLNPIGAPMAHIGLHVGAVVHNYDTDLFLPRTDAREPGPRRMSEPSMVSIPTGRANERIRRSLMGSPGSRSRRPGGE
jgi:hypothetical protein